MSAQSRAFTMPRSPPRILPALVVAYAVWALPMIGRWAVASLRLRTLVVEGLWQLLFIGVAVSLIGLVFRFVTARGASLVAASALATASALPVCMVGYIVDYYLGASDPTLAVGACDPPRSLAVALVNSVTDSFGIGLFLAAVVFLPFFARAHEERIRELDLVQRDAELLRVRGHLEPHFLLNSLNAVAGLVEEDPTQARELLAALGDLFRQASSFRATHRVADEIDWLRRYITIHELRHPDLLSVSWKVEESVLDLECPALILQPLVENAVKHGALRGAGHIVISASHDGGTLTFAIEDDGPELGLPRVGGQGVAIVRRRLELEGLAPSAFELVRENDRTVARVRIPARKEVRHV